MAQVFETPNTDFVSIYLTSGGHKMNYKIKLKYKD